MSTTTADTCPCTIAKEYRYHCGHSILRKGGSHEKHPACLVQASGCCTQVGDVRCMVFIINSANTDFENLTLDWCFQCRTEAEFRAMEPEATSAQVRIHVRRAMQESGIPQEHRACDTLLSTSRGRTKAINKGQKGYILARAKEQLEKHILGERRASDDMMYWLAGEVLSLCETLGDSRLARHFGRVIYLRCAGCIQKYLDDANPGVADVFGAAVGPRLARRGKNEENKAKPTGAPEDTADKPTAVAAESKQQQAQDVPEGGPKKARKTRRRRGKKSQQPAQDKAEKT